MKVMISIDHPAWVHQFKNIIRACTARGDEVRTLVVEKDGNTTLLDRFGIPYTVSAHTTGKNVIQKALLFAGLTLEHTWQVLRFQPDVVIGRASPMLAIAAKIAGKPHVIYEDTEVSKFSLNICKKCCTKILTPRTFLTDLGGCQERVDTYKELFYLHPDDFTPDKQLLRQNGFDPDEKYIFVRFVAWNASHDIGKKGLDDAGKIALVRRLEKYGRVWISSESELPEELKPNLLKTPYEMVHHVLAFAELVWSEGATMASEAAILGTHALYVNPIQSGSTKEQQARFDLLYCFHDENIRYEQSLDKAEELLSRSDLVEWGKEKQKKLLAEKVNINSYYLQEIDRLVRKK